MQKYIFKRVLAVTPVLFGVSILIFALVRVIPGDMATILAGEDATPELVEQILSYSGQRPSEPASIDLNDIVREVLHLVRATIRGGDTERVEGLVDALVLGTDALYCLLV